MFTFSICTLQKFKVLLEIIDKTNPPYGACRKKSINLNMCDFILVNKPVLIHLGGGDWEENSVDPPVKGGVE